MTTPEPLGPEPGQDAGLDELQADIERTRQQLGQTVEALSEKFDVKARAKHKAQDVKATVVDRAHTVRDGGTRLIGKAKDGATDGDGNVKPEVPAAAIAVGVVALIGVIVWWRRR